MDEKETRIRPVVSITPRETQPNKDAIEMLESMIERVKAGEITSVGLAYTSKSGSIGGDVSKSNDKFLMWASLEHLARTFYADIVLNEG